MKSRVSEQIAALPAMDKGQLLVVWNEYFSQAAPPKLRKATLASILAYRIQEREYGGLSNTARTRLKEIALRFRKEKQPAAQPHVEQGTRLIRHWRGEAHEVTSTDQGFVYRGQHYGSLSKIAREITGTRWSGPAFFGTKRKAS